MDSNSSSANTLSTETDVSDVDSIHSVFDSETGISSQTQKIIKSWTSGDTGISRKQSSRSPSQPSSLKYSRHFANVAVEDLPDSYSDTFDSVDSLNNSDDETVLESFSESASNTSYSAVNQKKEVHNSSSSSACHSDGRNESPKTDSSLGHTKRPLFEENDESRSYSSASNTETVSRDFSDENHIEVQSGSVASLSLSFSSVWECSSSDHSLGDKFTSADGEIVYYSDFSADALTARQYTHRSDDASELSYRARNRKHESGLQEFLRTKIHLLKQRDLFEREEHTSIPVKNKLAVKEVESDDLKRFCTMKLNHLKKSTQVDSGPVHSSRCLEHSSGFKRLNMDSDALMYGISEAAIQRLLDERLLMIDFHEPSSCSRCQNEMGLQGLNEFLRSKTAIVREKLINLQLHSAKNNSMYGMKIVGEILAEITRLNHDPDLVMRRLLEPLYNRDTCTK